MPKQNSESVPQPMQPVYDEITHLTDAVCRDHVDEEFAMLCRKLVAALARGKAKRETKDRTLATRVCRNCDARVPRALR